MEKEGLINFDKQGRLKLLTLTKKGGEVAEKIDHIRTNL
jgi:predicted transcriptional regulator